MFRATNRVENCGNSGGIYCQEDDIALVVSRLFAYSDLHTLWIRLIRLSTQIVVQNEIYLLLHSPTFISLDFSKETDLFHSFTVTSILYTLEKKVG